MKGGNTWDNLRALTIANYQTGYVYVQLNIGSHQIYFGVYISIVLYCY